MQEPYQNVAHWNFVSNCSRMAAEKLWSVDDLSAAAGITRAVAAVAMGLCDGEIRLLDLEAIATALGASPAALCTGLHDKVRVSP